jgi:type II secretory pathway pseudopilin PulG
LFIFVFCRDYMANKKRILPKNRGGAGFTIIELIIALVLSGFVITMMFQSWKYISNHLLRQQQKTLFQTEAGRIAQTILLQIRKSPEVVKVTSTSIVFLSHTSRDTVTYEFAYGAFLKNDTALWCDDRHARIDRFSIEKENAGPDGDTSNFIPLVITVGFIDRFGNSGAFPLKVRAAVSPDRLSTEAGAARGWNF